MRLTTNASQQTISANQPDSFGLGSVTSGTASAYAYGGAVGYREDGVGAAGLSSYYGFQKVGARYYDPTFGCFLIRDTDLTQKPYAYCGGDPVNCVDPDGHKKRKGPPKPNHDGSSGAAPSGPGSSGASDGGNGKGGTSAEDAAKAAAEVIDALKGVSFHGEAKVTYIDGFNQFGKFHKIFVTLDFSGKR